MAVKIETIRQEMVSWLNIFENREFYGLGDIVDEKKLRKFVMARSVSMLMSLFGIIIMEPYLFSSHAYDNLSWSHARHISTTIASIIETFIFVEALHKILTMGAVLKAMQKALLKTYLNRDFNVFKKQVHLIAAINDCTKLIMNLVTVLLTVWILASTVLLIFNIYALTDSASYNVLTIIVTNGKALYCILACTSFLYIHDENLKRKVS
jgi:hypothetical protein